MCIAAGPLLLAATAISSLGTGVMAVQAYSQNKYQQKVANNNAKLEDAAARDAIERGKRETQQYQRKLSQEQGAQRASLAANGIDVAFGSASDLRGDTAMLGQEDVQTMRENNNREVMGFERQAGNYRSQGKASRQAATGSLVKGVSDFGSTVLGGATQYAKFRAGLT